MLCLHCFHCLPLDQPPSDLRVTSVDNHPAASSYSDTLTDIQLEIMAGETQSLSPDSVIELAANALRREGGDQPSLKNPYEAIALVGHACMAAVGFRLVGLGEDHNIGFSTSPNCFNCT